MQLDKVKSFMLVTTTLPIQTARSVKTPTSRKMGKAAMVEDLDAEDVQMKIIIQTPGEIVNERLVLQTRIPARMPI